MWRPMARKRHTPVGIKIAGNIGTVVRGVSVSEKLSSWTSLPTVMALSDSEPGAVARFT